MNKIRILRQHVCLIESSKKSKYEYLHHELPSVTNINQVSNSFWILSKTTEFLKLKSLEEKFHYLQTCCLSLITFDRKNNMIKFEKWIDYRNEKRYHEHEIFEKR
jgi:hypothetical protein